MRAIGQQAAAGFAESFNAEAKSRLGQVGQQAAAGLGQALTSHLAEHLASAAGPMKDVVSGLLGKLGSGGAAEAGEAGTAMGEAMTAGLVGVVALGVKQVADDVKNIAGLVETEFSAFGKVGTDAANTLMSSFSSVVEGRGPNVKAAFSVVEEAVHAGLQAPINLLNTEIDNTVGRIPIIGGAFKDVGDEATEALSSAFEVFDQFSELGGELLETLETVGDEWSNISRTIAGQTLGADSLDKYLNTVKDIAASGAVENIHDVTDSIGLLGQRLSDLDGGAGLTQQQLQELATTFAQGTELLGYKLNVDAVSAAFNDFEVPAEQTNDELLTLVNTARLTGSNFNDLMQQVNAGAPTFQALGYTLDQTTFTLGKINQELGSGAANRWVMGVANADERAHKLGLSWTDVLNILNDYVKAGDKAGGVDYLKGLGMGAKVAQTTIDEVAKGILVLPDQVQAAIDAVGPALHEPLEDVLDQTEDLKDRWESIGGQMTAALAPLATGITDALGKATAGVAAWVAQNQSTIVTFVGHLVDFFATAAIDIAGVLGDTLQAIGPIIGVVESMVVGALRTVLSTVETVTGALSHLPFVGDMFNDVHNAIIHALGALDDISKLDLGKWASEGGAALDHLATDVLPKLKTSWDANVVKAGDIDAIGQAFKRNFLDPAAGQTAPALQNAFQATKDGIKLLGDPSTWAGVHDQLAKLGIGLSFDNAGTVTGITAQTQAEADALKDYWTGQFGSDHPLPINVAVTQGPPMSNDDARAKAGLPSEITVPVTPGPAAAGVPAFAPGAPLPFTPGSTPPGSYTPGDLGSLMHPSGYVPIPAQITIHPAADLEPNDLFGKAGITSHYLGDVRGASPGITLPTGFDVRDGEPKSLSDLMDAIGIPSEATGPDGVLLNVGFNTPTGTPGATMPAGSAGAAPGGGSSSGVQWDLIAQHESGGNWSLPSDSQGRPYRGGLQILDSTWAQYGGTAYAPTADKATREQQIEIAEKIAAGQGGANAWPNTWQYGQPAASSGTPITGGAGDGTYAGIGATDNASTASPKHGGIPGAPSGMGQDVLAYMRNVMDQFNQQTGAHRTVTADYPGGPKGHPDDGADHSVRRALDISSGSTAEMDAFAAMIANNPVLRDATRQLIHNPDGDGGSTFTDAMNIIGGHLTNGWQTYGSGGEGMPGHANHDHWALQYAPGQGVPASGPNIVPADYTGGVPQVWNVDRVTTPGDPTTPAPTTPGSSYATVPPPPGMTPAAPGAPNAIQTPYGSFQYTFNMPDDQKALLTPEQRQKFDTWLQKYERNLEQQTSTQTEIDQAQQNLDTITAKKNAADGALTKAQANEPPMSDDDRTNWEKSNADFVKATTEAAAANKEYAEATKRLAAAQQRQHDEQTSSQIEGEAPPPWEKAQKDAKPDANAETLGKGLVKGIMQEFGFPDVFGKPFNEWGIVKLLAGGAGFGLNLMENMGSGNASQTPAGGSTGSSTGLGLLDGIIPSLKNVFQPPQGQAPGLPMIPQIPAPPAPGTPPAGTHPAALPGQPGTPNPPGPLVIPAGLPGPGRDTTHLAQPGVFSAAQNWLPGGLNPGLHMASAAEKVDGTTNAIAGLVGAGVGAAMGMAGIGGAPPPASTTAAAVGTTTPPQPPPPDNTGTGTTYNALNIPITLGALDPDSGRKFVNGVINGSGTGSSQTATVGGSLGTLMA
jgi:hypothetical protein